MDRIQWARMFLVASLLGGGIMSPGLMAAESATVEKAAAVWNGMTWPIPKDAEQPQRRIAGLMYETAGDAQTAFDFQKKALLDAQWKEEPGAYLSKESSSGTYRKGDFVLSLSSYTAKPGQATVMINPHGNVDLGKLPVPAGAKSTYVGPASAMFVTDASPEKTADEVTKLLGKAGWQPYGAAPTTLWFKQNAVRLTAFVVTAPAQDNKTSLTYSTELMSADLPAPAVTSDLQYSDTTKTVSFDSRESMTDVLKFYQSALAKAGWKATHDELIKIDHRDTMIFRNAAKDMLTLEMHEIDRKTRCLLKHESAAEVQEKYEREKAAAMKAVSNKPTPSPKLSLKLPAKAIDVKVTQGEIGFKIANGQAKPAALEIAAALKADNWKAGEQVTDAMAGTLLFSKGDQSLTIIYLDTAVLPAEVTISATGVQLERNVGR